MSSITPVTHEIHFCTHKVGGRSYNIHIYDGETTTFHRRSRRWSRTNIRALASRHRRLPVAHRFLASTPRNLHHRPPTCDGTRARVCRARRRSKARRLLSTQIRGTCTSRTPTPRRSNIEYRRARTLDDTSRCSSSTIRDPEARVASGRRTEARRSPPSSPSARTRATRSPDARALSSRSPPWRASSPSRSSPGKSRAIRVWRLRSSPRRQKTSRRAKANITPPRATAPTPTPPSPSARAAMTSRPRPYALSAPPSPRARVSKRIPRPTARIPSRSIRRRSRARRRAARLRTRSARRRRRRRSREAAGRRARAASIDDARRRVPAVTPRRPRMSNEPDARAATATGALALDDAASAKFVRFYRGLPSETARVVRFFDRKDCISAHGDDAMYIARAFYKVRRERAGARVRSSNASARARCAGRARRRRERG